MTAIVHARTPGLWLDRRGVSIVEFGLCLPLLLGFALSGVEMANYILSNGAAQRLATGVADMVAQTGVGEIATSEAQIYDMFASTDATAKPRDIKNNGRVIFSVIKGVTQSDGSVRNEYADATYAQQFHGGYVAAVPLLGCRTTTPLPTFTRTLPANEIMVHAQTTYMYKPLFSRSLLTMFELPLTFTRTATARVRKNRFQITNDAAHPSKSRCDSTTGL